MNSRNIYLIFISILVAATFACQKSSESESRQSSQHETELNSDTDSSATKKSLSENIEKHFQSARDFFQQMNRKAAAERFRSSQAGIGLG